jgi:hypothetical protein
MLYDNKWQHLIKSLTIPKGFIRIGISKMETTQGSNEKEEKDKEISTKHFTEN